MPPVKLVVELKSVEVARLCCSAMEGRHSTASLTRYCGVFTSWSESVMDLPSTPESAHLFVLQVSMEDIQVSSQWDQPSN